ncbi:hypothetical protein NP590_03925 [Methylomonas sp. SURF-2]|uniref:SGNH hydrolase-type esterase domain-containing protein n=1 Tax=Methylomonas subterranea TaxID=2952225 RepID=A0ABT1TCU2_9GAMM|nr:hypothetical protein [Methylomonas sp. SURF-2]MCQ8103245.1 hypothetical protein [Methylomonas sp. SURF-2]
MGKRRAREIWEYDSMAEFEADGGAKLYGAGHVVIAGIGRYSDGSYLVDEIRRSPRVVRNISAQTARFPTASPLGTATATASRVANAHGVKSGLLDLDSLSAGRAFYSGTLTLDADTWYAISFDVTEMSGMVSGANSGFRLKTAGTAVIDNYSGDITETKLAAAGIGRYCAVFRSMLGGTTTFRLGVGLDSNVGNKRIKFKDFQWEKLTADSGGCAGDYVYPGYSAAFDTTNAWSMDGNGKLSQGSAKKFPVTPYAHILAVGDSRLDEPHNIAGQLNTLMGNEGLGVCAIHARGGWSTAHQLGPTSVNAVNMTEAVSVTFAEAILGGKTVRFFSTEGDEQCADNLGMPYDTLFVCDFGYNDINADTVNGPATVMAAVTYMCDVADSLNMRVILSDNNPFSAFASANAAKVAATNLLNQNLKLLAAERGYLFVSAYAKLSDSTSFDKLSDGAGTTPNYSQDGLHLNDAGSLLYAQIALAVINANR